MIILRSGTVRLDLDLGNHAFRSIVNAACCFENIDLNANDLVCGKMVDLATARQIGVALDKHCRLKDNTINLTPRIAKVLRTAQTTLAKMGPIKARKLSLEDYENLLAGLYDVDELWELTRPTLKISGAEIPKSEIEKFVKFVRRAKQSIKINY